MIVFICYNLYCGERSLRLKDAEVNLAQRRVTVSVPATVANLGPGLEVVGMAVDIWDEFTLEFSDHFSVELRGPDTPEAGVPTISYYIISYHIISYHIILYYIILYCIVLYYLYYILHYIILYYITLHYIILYYIILHYIILYCII